MMKAHYWLGFAFALAVLTGLVGISVTHAPVYASGSEVTSGEEDGSSGMGDPDMPDAGKDPNTTQGSLRYERIDSGREIGVRPQPEVSDVTRVAPEPLWKQWLRALGVLSRIGWF
jgi:hypothetical protein